MATHQKISNYDGIYFITFTNKKWIPLFHLTNAYDAVYKWFDHLKKSGHYVVAYVIMPNHLHVIVAFTHTQGKSINSIIGNAKRMMAYQIIKRIKNGGQEGLLSKLASFVSSDGKKKGKAHEVFEPSFDWKECTSAKFINQKIEYIHLNPCQVKWNLATHPAEFIHSSARFYIYGRHSRYEVTSYAYLDDVDLTKPFFDFGKSQIAVYPQRRTPAHSTQRPRDGRRCWDSGDNNSSRRINSAQTSRLQLLFNYSIHTACTGGERCVLCARVLSRGG